MRSFITLLATCILFLLPTLTFAYDFATKKGDVIIYYNKLSDTECEVTSSPKDNQYIGVIAIPSAINNNGNIITVTAIGDGAFEGTKLVSITIPNSVTSIGDKAFKCCGLLTSINLPNSVTSIGIEAFSDCYNLTTITLSNSLTSIGKTAFQGCYRLNSITLPNSLNFISDWAFQECSGLISITLPNSLQTIGRCAFRGCRALRSITIPKSVKNIGEGAFEECRSFTSFTILAQNPPSVGKYAFDYSSIRAATLYIPIGARSRFVSQPWTSFNSIIER